MRCQISKYLPVLGALVLASSSFVGASAQEKQAAPQAIVPADPKLGRPVDFERDVFPILDSKCVACHNVAITENGLNLEDIKGIMKGGKRGPSVIAKDPDKSWLYKLAARGAQPAMPPLPNKVEASGLTPNELGVLKRVDSQRRPGRHRHDGQDRPMAAASQRRRTDLQRRTHRGRAVRRERTCQPDFHLPHSHRRNCRRADRSGAARHSAQRQADVRPVRAIATLCTHSPSAPMAAYWLRAVTAR